MAQGVGYAIAAAGPIALGAAHQITGAWSVPVLIMMAATVAQLFCGLGAALPRTVGAPRASDPE
jgi:CP family cyanate transporter-like MFS transporter